MDMAKSVPNIRFFSGGGGMPQIAFGTKLWQCPADETMVEAVKTAIDVGYRHFDTASDYKNEQQLGQGLNEKIKAGDVTREDLFVTTKLWCNAHRASQVKPALQESLKNLNLFYVDLYLIHFPMAYEDYYSGELDVDYLETWSAMEKLVDEGLAKRIGVSNFNKDQLQRLLDNCTRKPQNLQIEIHPHLTNTELVNFALSVGVTVTGYSPLASPDPLRFGYSKEDPNPLQNPKVEAIAKAHNRTPAQVILRWHVQRGYAVAVKTMNRARMEENLKIFDFALSLQEMDSISSLNSNFRILGVGYKQLGWVNHKDFPF